MLVADFQRVDVSAKVCSGLMYVCIRAGSSSLKCMVISFSCYEVVFFLFVNL